jgi:Phosphotransferase enzyme family
MRRPPNLDAALVTSLVRASLGRPTADVQRWQVTPIDYPAPSALTTGLFRISGTAVEHGTELSWSLVLKTIHCPSDSARHVHDLGYWKREALVYESVLLADLPSGLMLPRCHGTQVFGDDTAWLWLEEVTDKHDGLWNENVYCDIARQFGEWQGSYPATRNLPSEPWLARGLIADVCEHRAGAYSQMALEQDPWDDPRWRRVFPRAVVERLQHVLQARKPLLAALERAPQTVCHFDLSRHNLLRRMGVSGRGETVVIDWAYAGIGALGVDLSLLVPSPFFRMEADIAGLADQAEAVFAAYVDGLHSAGWRGDEHAVRFAYAASTALRTVFLSPTIAAAIDPAACAAEELRWGLPLDAILERRAAVTVFLLDLADEAMALLEAVS